MLKDEKDTVAKSGELTKSSSVGIGQLIDGAMNQVLIQKFAELFSSSIALTPRHVLGFLTIVVAHENKDSLKSFFGGLPRTTWHYLNRLAAWRTARLPSVEVIAPEESDFRYSHTLDFLFDASLLEALYLYLNLYVEDATRVSFCRRIKQMDSVNSQEKVLTEQYTQVVIMLDQMTYSFNHELIFQTNLFTKKLIQTDIPKSSSGSFRYRDILSPGQRKAINDLDVKLSDEQKQQMGNTEMKYEYEKEFFTTRKLATMMAEKLKTPIEDTIFSVHAVWLFLHYQGKINHTAIFKKIKGGRTFFDPYHDYLEELKKFTGEGSCVNAIPGFDVKFFRLPEYRAFDDFMTIQPLKQIANQKSEIRLISPNPINESLALETLVTELQKCHHRVDQAINVYTIKLVKKIETKKVVNIRYEEWEAKRQIIEQLDAKLLKEYFEKPIPPREINQEIITKIIEKTTISQVDKSIHTLYLKEKDMEVLLSALDQFKNDKDFLKSHGLKSKLNILLHGPPGTGKSSSIEAVATYLRRDLYYVDLKNAQTNGDLQQIFDYINTGTNTSGIVVIEDIDSMTNIVLQRAETVPEPSTVTVMQPEETLTLDYFLNVLQGTATREDSVFLITTNYFSKLDSAFTRDGRFDVKLKLEHCDHHQIRQIFQAFLDRPIDETVLQRLPELTFSPATLIYTLKQFRRRKHLTDAEILVDFLPV